MGTIRSWPTAMPRLCGIWTGLPRLFRSCNGLSNAIRDFVSAVYLLGTLYMRNKKMAEAKSLMSRFRELNQDELAVGTFVVDDKYGMAGKYYFVLGADGLPLPPPPRGPVAAGRVFA